MVTATLISVEEYLATSYRPDRREHLAFGIPESEGGILKVPGSPIQIPLNLFADPD
jgi:hypothetical protein